MVLGPGLQGSFPVAAAIPSSAGNRNVLYAAAPFIFLICFGIFSLVLNESSMYNLKLHNTANVSTSPAPPAVPKRTVVPTCMSKMELEQIQSATVTAKNQIYSFWDVSHMSLFLTTMNIPQKSWEIQKLKFMQLLLESGTYRSGKGDERRYEYVVGFSGSSVTAGDDPTHMTSLHIHFLTLLTYFLVDLTRYQVMIVTFVKPIPKCFMTQCCQCFEPCPG